MLGAASLSIDSGMVPWEYTFQFEFEVKNVVDDLKIPFQDVEAINVGMRVALEIDAIYKDDQYEDKEIVLNKGL